MILRRHPLNRPPGHTLNAHKARHVPVGINGNDNAPVGLDAHVTSPDDDNKENIRTDVVNAPTISSDTTQKATMPSNNATVNKRYTSNVRDITARNYFAADEGAARRGSLHSEAGAVIALVRKPDPAVVVATKSAPALAFIKGAKPAILCGECRGKGWLLCEGRLRIECDVCQETGAEPCSECDDGTPATEVYDVRCTPRLSMPLCARHYHEYLDDEDV